MVVRLGAVIQHHWYVRVVVQSVVVKRVEEDAEAIPVVGVSKHRPFFRSLGCVPHCLPVHTHTSSYLQLEEHSVKVNQQTSTSPCGKAWCSGNQQLVPYSLLSKIKLNQTECNHSFIASTLLVGWQKKHPACKKSHAINCNGTSVRPGLTWRNLQKVGQFKTKAESGSNATSTSWADDLNRSLSKMWIQLYHFQFILVLKAHHQHQ